MYIAQVFKVAHDWWRYIIGLTAVFIGIIIFSLPHAFAIMVKTFDGEIDQSQLGDVNYLMGLFESNLNLVFILLPFVGGFIVLPFLVKYLHKQSFRSLTTGRNKVDWKRIWFAFLFWGIISSGLIFADYFANPEGYVWNFKPTQFAILCVLAVLLIPIQTSFEEYLFRGYLVQGIGVSSSHKYFPFVIAYCIIAIFAYIALTYQFELNILLKAAFAIVAALLLIVLVYSKPVAKFVDNAGYQSFFKLLNRKSTPIIITSVAFGLMHIANPEIEKLGYILLVYYIGTGFFLAIMTIMDDGLELAIGFHAANNLFTALLVTADWTAFQTHSIFKDTSDPTEAGFVDVFAPVFIIFPILLIIFAKIYKWNNWKEKLFGRIQPPPAEDYKVLDDVAK